MRPKVMQGQILEGRGFSLKSSRRRDVGAELLGDETTTLGSANACAF